MPNETPSTVNVPSAAAPAQPAAAVETDSLSKAYPGMDRPALDAVDAPRLGQNLDLTLANLNPSITVGVFALSLATIAPTPLDPIGMPGCTGYVAPDLLLNGTAAGGTATLQLPLPGTQALIGTSIFAQGLSFDPGINAAWLAASNAFAGVIGN